ncbi:hypothetical protein PP175_25230 (plasmid) [Aneurinibacillus sp. Ricciae_BoGa-3]|uniref:hypothetical protein n=1 Tax=Aneurinibacillus sp. Ricciae_BoGa-3 TaxID=3022697 RepID=UPI002340DD20|nr:hypothetical protein [Aneurinibacillus sp. Ricciae_BoGa-3]WCK57372.1 hypothetical protein PP175_25230 [Aneurinibacillus sp. Ricciae_BoGa-3]
MKNKNKKRTKHALKVLIGTSIIASTLLSGQAFASITNSLIEKNHFGGDATVQVSTPVAPNVLNDAKTQNQKVMVPLVKSVTPAIGATVVRPDANVVIQLDPTSKEYHLALAMLKNGFVEAYVLDGKSVTQLPQADIQFDSTTNQVILSHDVLKRYTEQSIVLTAGQNDLQKDIQDKLDKANVKFALPQMDVVTAVDDTAQAITLLNGGVISYANFDKEAKGLQWQGQHEVWQHGDNESNLEKAKNTLKLSNLFKVGNVVYTKVNPLDNQNHIVMKNPMAISSLFTTGSAVGEATHVASSLDNASVKVTDGGKLNVNATDDYGDPATNATVTVTGQGTGNAKLASSFTTPHAITMTNGTASVPLVDHTAEKVTLTFALQDNTFKDAVDNQSGNVVENFLPGQTAQLKYTNPSKFVVGTTASIKGVAEDIYGNTVADGTQVNIAAQRGTIAHATPTTNGDFSFDYQASTKSGADALTLTGADSGYKTTDSINVAPGQTAQIQVTNPQNIIAGQTATFKGMAKDSYGNTVMDGTQMNETVQNGTISNASKSANGAFTFDVQSTKAGANSVKVSGADSGFTINDGFTVVHDATSKASINLPSNLKVGQNVTVSGAITDKYGNPVNNQSIVFGGALTGTLTSDANGSYLGSVKVASSGSVSASVGGKAVSLANASGAPITSISATAATQTYTWYPYNTYWMGTMGYQAKFDIMYYQAPLGDLTFELVHGGFDFPSNFSVSVSDSVGHTIKVLNPTVWANTRTFHLTKSDLLNAGLKDIRYFIYTGQSYVNEQVGITNVTLIY